MRPELHAKTDPEVFRDFYWLKEELVAFCKQYHLPRSGKKQELAERVYEFLKSGDVLPPVKKKAQPRSTQALSLSSDDLLKRPGY